MSKKIELIADYLETVLPRDIFNVSAIVAASVRDVGDFYIVVDLVTTSWLGDVNRALKLYVSEDSERAEMKDLLAACKVANDLRRRAARCGGEWGAEGGKRINAILTDAFRIVHQHVLEAENTEATAEEERLKNMLDSFNNCQEQEQ